MNKNLFSAARDKSIPNKVLSVSNTPLGIFSFKFNLQTRRESFNRINSEVALKKKA